MRKIPFSRKTNFFAFGLPTSPAVWKPEKKRKKKRQRSEEEKGETKERKKRKKRKRKEKAKAKKEKQRKKKRATQELRRRREEGREDRIGGGPSAGIADVTEVGLFAPITLGSDFYNGIIEQGKPGSIPDAWRMAIDT
ncbi:MAG: hypothetical protein ACAH17_00785 [Candidatus Paceibacterota bacterium]